MRLALARADFEAASARASVFGCEEGEVAEGGGGEVGAAEDMAGGCGGWFEESAKNGSCEFCLGAVRMRAQESCISDVV